MTFKSNDEYTISSQEHIDAAFTDRKLPSNAFIHKGRCGIGGTTLEMKCHRHSIITVPTTAVIADKLKDKEHLPYGLFPVMGGVTVEQIKAYLLKTLNTPGKYIKIMSTPDSFGNIMKAAKDIPGFDITQDCFLLLDECHTFVTEAFRKAILTPFRWFWLFKDKSVISATPYYFTDKRFERFSYHRIRFREPYLGKVNVIRATSVAACLNHALTNEQYPGNVHIFYNSVTECVKAIKRAELKAGAIFYADKAENHEKLAGFEAFYQDEPSDKVYRKFNFYTCKYNEGWDLKDKDATIILVTDVNIPHTRVRISNKGVQAIGRSRIPPHEIYHITNHRNTDKMKTQEQITTDYQIQADAYIQAYNNAVKQGAEPIPEFKTLVEKFADIADNQAVYNSNKFDQMVNDQLACEEYADMEIIGKQWEAGLYEPTLYQYEERLTKATTREKRASKADKLKAAITEIERLEAEEKQIAFNLGTSELAGLKDREPFAWEAYKALGKTELEKLAYNVTAIKAALITKSNHSAERKLKLLLNLAFQVDERYTKSEIKQTLQRLYNKVDLKDKQGKPRIATAEQLADHGRFEIEECKKKVNDTWEPAFKILRKQFGLKLSDAA